MNAPNRFCGHCGGAAASVDRFCGHCGQPTDNPAEVDTELLSRAPVYSTRKNGVSENSSQQ